MAAIPELGVETSAGVEDFVGTAAKARRQRRVHIFMSREVPVWLEV